VKSYWLNLHLDYFRRLGHDNHRRVSKLYGWEEKKGKTSWGAETVDYEKIAATAVRDMKTAEVQRFLVVCALVSDLHCPGYDAKQPLAKDSNLARTAARYKIHSPKIAAAVRGELCQSTGSQLLVAVLLFPDDSFKPLLAHRR